MKPNKFGGGIRFSNALMDSVNMKSEHIQNYKKKVIMNAKRFEIIWDFCDWLGCQGLAYETLYYGETNDIKNLINRYLEDEEWANREDGDMND